MYPRMFGMLQYVFVGSWIWCFLCIQLNLFGMNEWIICIISLYIIYFAPGTDVGCSIEEKQTDRQLHPHPDAKVACFAWWHCGDTKLRSCWGLWRSCWTNVWSNLEWHQRLQQGPRSWSLPCHCSGPCMWKLWNPAVDMFRNGQWTDPGSSWLISSLSPQ